MVDDRYVTVIPHCRVAEFGQPPESRQKYLSRYAVVQVNHRRRPYDKVADNMWSAALREVSSLLHRRRKLVRKTNLRAAMQDSAPSQCFRLITMSIAHFTREYNSAGRDMLGKLGQSEILSLGLIYTHSRSRPSVARCDGMTVALPGTSNDAIFQTLQPLRFIYTSVSSHSGNNVRVALPSISDNIEHGFCRPTCYTERPEIVQVS